MYITFRSFTTEFNHILSYQFFFFICVYAYKKIRKRNSQKNMVYLFFKKKYKKGILCFLKNKEMYFDARKSSVIMLLVYVKIVYVYFTRSLWLSNENFHLICLLIIVISPRTG